VTNPFTQLNTPISDSGSRLTKQREFPYAPLCDNIVIPVERWKYHNLIT